MNTGLWIIQGLLAAGCGLAGLLKLSSSKEKLLSMKMGWTADFTEGQIKLIALAEVLGAVGLIVPRYTGIMPILTPVAAVCLAIVMAGAVATHLRRKESVMPSALFAVFGVFIAVGRWFLAP